MTEYFDDRVTVTVTTTKEGAVDILHGIEYVAHDSADPGKTWVTVAPVEKPDIMQSSNVDQANPNEDSWS
ncbi:hypothetical protein AB3R30_21710 [Leptolyngbyaceae cyanobacterium UHCC 1019]